ncbi:MAG: LysE family transporter [Nitrososphaeraceae archaeon]|nr:LysE family transporter [Nitrososphaeraceae archaeon]
MNILEFAGEVVLLSTSGVLSPGPLFFTNLIYGSRQGSHAGIKIAYGHTIVELPLIIILALGLSNFSYLHLTSKENLKIIGLIGGVSIVLFSLIQVRSITKRNAVESAADAVNKKNYFFKINSKRNEPIILGIIFSALNPFFLIWWSTIGLKLISDSIILFGVVLGILCTFLFHIWMDYAWLMVTSYMISKGISILKTKFYYVLFLVLSIVLALYGLYIIVLNIVQAIAL